MNNCLPGTPCYDAYYHPNDCGCENCIIKSNHVIYIGPNLPHSGINNSNNLTTALAKLDNALNPATILSAIGANPELKAQLCEIISDCGTTTTTTTSSPSTTTTTSSSTSTTTTTTTLDPYTYYVADYYSNGNCATPSSINHTIKSLDSAIPGGKWVLSQASPNVAYYIYGATTADPGAPIAENGTYDSCPFK